MLKFSFYDDNILFPLLPLTEYYADHTSPIFRINLCMFVLLASADRALRPGCEKRDNLEQDLPRTQALGGVRVHCPQQLGPQPVHSSRQVPLRTRPHAGQPHKSTIKSQRPSPLQSATDSSKSCFPWAGPGDRGPEVPVPFHHQSLRDHRRSLHGLHQKPTHFAPVDLRR